MIPVNELGWQSDEVQLPITEFPHGPVSSRNPFQKYLDPRTLQMQVLRRCGINQMNIGREIRERGNREQQLGHQERSHHSNRVFELWVVLDTLFECQAADWLSVSANC
jgi:hypothetical protein